MIPDHYAVLMVNTATRVVEQPTTDSWNLARSVAHRTRRAENVEAGVVGRLSDPEPQPIEEAGI